jgi:hypothetical protein
MSKQEVELNFRISPNRIKAVAFKQKELTGH